MLVDAGAAEVHVRISSPPGRVAVLLRHRHGRRGRARRRPPLGRGDARADRGDLAPLPLARGDAVGHAPAGGIGVPCVLHARVPDRRSGRRQHQDAFRGPPRRASRSLEAARGIAGADLRRRRGVACDCRRDRRPPPRRRRPRPPRPASRVLSARSPVSSRSTTGACWPRPRTRSARSSCWGGAVTGCAGAEPTSPHTASTTSSRPEPSRSSSSTTSPPTRSTSSRWRSWSKARPTSAALPAARSWAARRRSSPGSTVSPRSTSAAPPSGSSTVTAWSTARGSRPATSSSVSPRRESTRTASRSCGASSATRRSTRTCSCRRPGSTSTTFGLCGPVPTCERSRTSPAAASPATWPEPCRTASAPSSIPVPGSGPRCSRGSRRTASPRTSCAASSTSGSATARSFPLPMSGADDSVIGTIVHGSGVAWE